jgi:hypothetical protein
MACWDGESYLPASERYVHRPRKRPLTAIPPRAIVPQHERAPCHNYYDLFSQQHSVRSRAEYERRLISTMFECSTSSHSFCSELTINASVVALLATTCRPGTAEKTCTMLSLSLSRPILCETHTSPTVPHFVSLRAGHWPEFRWIALELIFRNLLHTAQHLPRPSRVHCHASGGSQHEKGNGVREARR